MAWLITPKKLTNLWSGETPNIRLLSKSRLTLARSDVCETGDWFPNEIENLGFYERDNRDFVYMKITDGPRSKTAYSWMKSVNGEPKHAHGRFVVGILYLKPRQEGRVNLDYLLYWVNNNKSLRGFGLRALEERLRLPFFSFLAWKCKKTWSSSSKTPLDVRSLVSRRGGGVDPRR